MATVGLVVAAVATELAKPAEERTWHGRVFDLVPYDFRRPTLERIKAAYWNPESDRILSDRVFGVGWAVNFFRVKTLLNEAFSRLMGAPEPTPIRMAGSRNRAAEAPDEVEVD
ncbi:MAG TPA: hypothetical protein VEW68_09735 [Patescibacteria group bacterium]|nr:hypothetical protein [Patescibacteria group bacterium]